MYSSAFLNIRVHTQLSSNICEKESKVLEHHEVNMSQQCDVAVGGKENAQAEIYCSDQRRQ